MTDKVSQILKQIEEQHQLTIHRMGDAKWPEIQRIPSGSLALDYALGGGWPRGRFAEIFGQPSGGKTFLTLLAIAKAQRLGGRAVFIDVEHSFDPAWAESLGVDVPNLYITQPDYGEQALDSIRTLAQSNEFDIIVLDSIAELVPKSELDGSIEDQGMAVQARMMSKALRVLSPAVGKTKAVVLFINQVRQTMAMYGSPTTTPGGQAFKFYASLRVQVSRVSKSERYDDAKNVIGHDISASVIKNKTAPPFRVAPIPIEYMTGVRLRDDLVNTAQARGIIKFSGGVKYFGSSVESLKEMRWPKWEDFHNWLEDANLDPTIRLALEREIAGD